MRIRFGAPCFQDYGVYHLEQGFAPQLRGPKSAEVLRLAERITTLETQNQQLMAENAELSVRLNRSVEITPQRLQPL